MGAEASTGREKGRRDPMKVIMGTGSCVKPWATRANPVSLLLRGEASTDPHSAPTGDE